MVFVVLLWYLCNRNQWSSWETSCVKSLYLLFEYSEWLKDADSISDIVSMPRMPFFYTNLFTKKFSYFVKWLSCFEFSVTQNMKIWLMEFALPRHFQSNCTKIGKWESVYFCVRVLVLIWSLYVTFSNYILRLFWWNVFFLTIRLIMVYLLDNVIIRKYRFALSQDIIKKRTTTIINE